MEDYTPPRYCVKCGSLMQNNETFCTICGAKTNSSGAEKSSQKGNKLLVIGIFSVIWALCGIGLGLDTILTADEFISQTDSLMPGFWDAMEEFGITADYIESMIVSIGAVITVSGLLAAITAVLSFAKRQYTIALIACILSSILALILLVGIIGFIVAYFITQAKEEFVDSSPTL